MEDISKFYQDFMAQAQEDAELNETTLEDALTENIIEYIKESNETNSPEILCIHPLDEAVKKRWWQIRINIRVISTFSY